MGRHSAPDDQDEEDVAGPLDVLIAEPEPDAPPIVTMPVSPTAAVETIIDLAVEIHPLAAMIEAIARSTTAETVGIWTRTTPRGTALARRGAATATTIVSAAPAQTDMDGTGQQAVVMMPHTIPRTQRTYRLLSQSPTFPLTSSNGC